MLGKLKSPGEAPRGGTGGPPADAGPLSLPAAFLECSCCNAKLRLTCNRSRSRADKTGVCSAPAMSFAGVPLVLFATRRPPVPLPSCLFVAPPTSAPGAIMLAGRTKSLPPRSFGSPLSLSFHSVVMPGASCQAHHYIRKNKGEHISTFGRSARNLLHRPGHLCAHRKFGQAFAVTPLQILLSYENRGHIHDRTWYQSLPVGMNDHDLFLKCSPACDAGGRRTSVLAYPASPQGKVRMFHRSRRSFSGVF